MSNLGGATVIDQHISCTNNWACVDFRAISAWDLTEVKEYAVDNGVFERAEIDSAEIEYRRYITLCFEYPNIVMPLSKMLDNFWHAHILFTKDYTNMCFKAGGYYLHHLPGIPGKQKSALRICDSDLKLYRLAFGEPDPRFWASHGDCRPCDTDPNELKTAH